MGGSLLSAPGAAAPLPIKRGGSAAGPRPCSESPPWDQPRSGLAAAALRGTDPPAQGTPGPGPSPSGNWAARPWEPLRPHPGTGSAFTPLRFLADAEVHRSPVPVFNPLCHPLGNTRAGFLSKYPCLSE